MWNATLLLPWVCGLLYLSFLTMRRGVILVVLLIVGLTVVQLLSNQRAFAAIMDRDISVQRNQGVAANKPSTEVYTCFNGTHTVSMPNGIPSFILIGAQKAGTTALSNLFGLHPNMQRAIRREPHFFDFLGHQHRHFNITAMQACWLRQNYIQNGFRVDTYNGLSRALPGGVLTWEKTPAYIRVPGVAAVVRRVLGRNVKILAVLRDPVDRLYSAYTMTHYKVRTFNKTFDEFVDEALAELRDEGGIRARSVAMYRDRPETAWSTDDFQPLNSTMRERLVEAARTRRLRANHVYAGMYSMHLPWWLEHFRIGDTLKVIKYERMKDDFTSVFDEIIDFLGAPPAMIEKDAFLRRYDLFERHSHRGPPGNMTASTEAYLRQLYKGYNEELSHLLGDEWRDCWS